MIAGAGIIGLSTALELYARGHQVTVLERGNAVREASWAAAGMLAAQDPENPSALSAFARFSFGLYPEFLARIEALSGMRVPLHTQHTLQVVDEDPGKDCFQQPGSGLARRTTDQRTLPIADQQKPDSTRFVSSSEAAGLVPGLHLRMGQHALWLDEQSLDPRELGRALTAAVIAAGVRLEENAPVLSTSLPASGDGLLTIATPASSYHADVLVVTTGAWAAYSGQGAGPHTLPPGHVLPRKGQMLRLRPLEGARLTTVLRSPTIYIVPRANGSLIVGATVEDAGFDRTIHEDATAWLLREAAQLWWPIAGITRDQIEEVWTGIRPATPDALPILGSAEEGQARARVLFATGHYRNGILLAPGTARLMGELLDGQPPAIDLSLFSPRRMLAPSDLDASNSCSHDKETSAAL